MGAQRHTKILGIFVRLDRRDGKPQYLKHLPRIRDYLQRTLAHPALADVRNFTSRQASSRFRRGQAHPNTAMVLAAGLGKRMRPITDTIPKPLVRVAGKTLLDWGLDTLAAAGVTKAVVNVHYFPQQIVAHVAARAEPRCDLSDESAQLLDSAGGIVRALPELGTTPFFIVNADTFWIDAGRQVQSRPACACMAGRGDGYSDDACRPRLSNRP